MGLRGRYIKDIELHLPDNEIEEEIKQPRRIADACNRAPAVDFDIAVHVILAGVAVYGGKGFNAVAAVAA